MAHGKLSISLNERCLTDGNKIHVILTQEKMRQILGTCREKSHSCEISFSRKKNDDIKTKIIKCFLSVTFFEIFTFLVLLIIKRYFNKNTKFECS